MGKEEVGHNFLARLGKTRLRPGGRKATDWLIASGDFSSARSGLQYVYYGHWFGEAIWLPD